MIIAVVNKLSSLHKRFRKDAFLCEVTDDVFAAEHEWDENSTKKGRKRKRSKASQMTLDSSVQYLLEQKNLACSQISR